MSEPQSAAQIAARYIRFAENEAHGRSPLYEELALGVAGDGPALAFLADLPYAKQQPNLLLAAVRHVCGTPADWNGFSCSMRSRPNEIRATMLERRTQTNEPARCATLLPLLALLPQPLALIEVGSSAGLCLIPDRYAYRYNEVDVGPSANAGPEPPRFFCATNAQTPVPKTNVEIVWRMGLDLEPVGIEDDEQVAWLETLVWPGEENRLDLLRQAVNVARNDPPMVMRGDLRTDLPSLFAKAPADATLVVFHSAVLAYVSSETERKEFAEAIARINGVWIANESPRMIPGITEKVSGLCRPGEFLVALNGKPIACGDPHGKSLRWL